MRDAFLYGQDTPRTTHIAGRIECVHILPIISLTKSPNSNPPTIPKLLQPRGTLCRTMVVSLPCMKTHTSYRHPAQISHPQHTTSLKGEVLSVGLEAKDIKLFKATRKKRRSIKAVHRTSRMLWRLSRTSGAQPASQDHLFRQKKKDREGEMANR